MLAAHHQGLGAQERELILLCTTVTLTECAVAPARATVGVQGRSCVSPPRRPGSEGAAERAGFAHDAQILF